MPAVNLVTFDKQILRTATLSSRLPGLRFDLRFDPELGRMPCDTDTQVSTIDVHEIAAVSAVLLGCLENTEPSYLRLD